MSFKILDPNIFFPNQLNKEIEELKQRISIAIVPPISANRFEILLNKLEKSEKLSERDVRQLLFNIDEIPPVLLKKIYNLINSLINNDNFSFFFEQALDNMQPWKTIRSISYCLQLDLSTIQLPKLIKLKIELLKNFETFEEFIFEVVRDYKFIDNFLNDSELNKFRNTGVWEKVLVSESSYEFFLNDNNNYLVELNKLDNVTFFQTIDFHIRKYQSSNSAWTSSVLSNDSFLGQLIQNVRLFNYPVSNYGLALKEILNIKDTLIEAFNLLRQKDIQRADYWVSHMNKFSEVIPRKFSKDKLIGLAMYVGNKVIVEFAPSGNAAYIYKRNVFDEKIKRSENWKQVENLENDIYINLDPHSKFNLTEGKFFHRVGWTDDMRKILERILNGK